MRRCASSVAAFSIALLACVAPLATPAASLPSISSPAVQSAIVAAVQRDRVRFGGHAPIPATTIGVWDDKGHSFVRTFGYANLANKAPLTIGDHFRIGSNTKTFVSACYSSWSVRKRLASTIRSAAFRWACSIPNAKNITVRELCDMRSGLFEAYDTPQFAALNWKVPKNFSRACSSHGPYNRSRTLRPNKGYRYSNTNYILLGLIIEGITNDTVGNRSASGLSNRSV